MYPAIGPSKVPSQRSRGEILESFLEGARSCRRCAQFAGRARVWEFSAEFCVLRHSVFLFLMNRFASVFFRFQLVTVL